MQKQYSQTHSSQDKHSICSRSARKLYYRIHNNNIRLLNKSKISNHSNRSIGSVALRRTQLSNDKLYSRQEQIIALNSSQVGLSLESGFDLQFEQQSIPMTPIVSNHNYRQRGMESPSKRSLRSISQKSSKYRPNHRKYNKNEIEKLLMLEENNNFNNGTQNKGQQNKRQIRPNNRRQKQSILSPRMQDNQYSDQNDSKLRSIWTIKSSSKSNFKIYSSPNIKQKQKYGISPHVKNQMQNLTTNQKQTANGKSIKHSKNIISYNQRIEQMYIGEKKEVKNDCYEKKRENSRNLQKYQSQKYLLSNDCEVQAGKSRKKRTHGYQVRFPGQYNIGNTLRHEQRRDQRDKHNSKRKNYKKQNRYENQLVKYQKDTWARTNLNQKFVIRPIDYNDAVFQDDNGDKQIKQEYPDSFQQTIKLNQKFSKQYNKNHKMNNKMSKLSNVKSKHQRSQLQIIKIKEQAYGDLYGSYKNERILTKAKSRRHNQKLPSYNSCHHKQKAQPDDDYCHNIHYSNNKQKPSINMPQTQISSTFDSLMLSINSRITSGIGASTNVKSTLDKINLHLETLELIADYALEFKKMYEQIEDWEELIFLAYKKFWVQRTKVLDYLKKFKKSKRHESQRIMQNGSKKALYHKLSSTKEISSEVPRLSKVDDPFSDQNLITNPFMIPFCKISQEQVKKLVQSQQGSILIEKLYKQITQIYQTLQQLYNLAISKSGERINMLYCDNFTDEIFVMMLDEIEQLIPNLEEFKLFEATKIRLGKIVKTGILILFMDGKVIRNIAEIITFDDCERISSKRKIKTFTTYDLYYEVFEKVVAE